MIDKLLAKKSLQNLSKDASDTIHGLRQVLGPWHLVFLGIGTLFAFVIVCSGVLILWKSKLRHNSNRIE